MRIQTSLAFLEKSDVMRQLLEARNRALLRDLEILTSFMGNAHIPTELGNYKERLLVTSQGLRLLAERNIRDLSLGRGEILDDVLSNTQQVALYVRLFSARLAVPILRASSLDRLSLMTIAWLHGQHEATKSFPAAFADGDCSMWPFIELAPIYFFPCLEQRGLLYQPLFFHEFGHLLYACHKQEMDDLVGELQREIEDVLIPISQRNDRHADIQAGHRQVIVDTWYRWAQEFFCDAVGFTIGGPCFLHAFSAYVGTMERGDFYRQPIDLQHSEHPVTRLRVKLLCNRAQAQGFEDTAEAIEKEWNIVADLMGIHDDYHGFYDDSLEQPVTRIMDDMLTEAGARRCSISEAGGNEWNEEPFAFVSLLNQAWKVYQNNPNDYEVWESSVLSRIIT
jgi:hypothetical protein